jgi:hypothetical protein
MDRLNRSQESESVAASSGHRKGRQLERLMNFGGSEQRMAKGLWQRLAKR